MQDIEAIVKFIVTFLVHIYIQRYQDLLDSNCKTIFKTRDTQLRPQASLSLTNENPQNIIDSHRALKLVSMTSSRQFLYTNVKITDIIHV